MSEADPIVIRPANDADRDFVAGLVSSLLEFGSPMWRDAEALAPGFREALIRALANRDARSPLLIAQDEDGTPLGFISLKVSKDVAGVERGHVADLAVKANARRTGVGSALMGAAEAWAREQRLPALSLGLKQANGAELWAKIVACRLFGGGRAGLSLVGERFGARDGVRGVRWCRQGRFLGWLALSRWVGSGVSGRLGCC